MNSEQVQLQIKELESLRSQMRMWRMAVMLVILAMILITVGTLVSSVRGLAEPGPRQEQFVTELSTGLQEGTMPEIQRIASQTLNSINMQEEFAKLNSRTPELAEATMQEFQTLSENLPESGERVLNATFGEMINSREEGIREMYPDVTEDKVHTLVTNLSEEAQVRTAQITQRLFDPHLKSMNAIVEETLKIADTEAVNPREVPTWQMALLIFDIAREEFKGLEVYQGLNAPGGTGKGKGVKVQGFGKGAKPSGAKPSGAKPSGAKPQAVKPSAAQAQAAQKAAQIRARQMQAAKTQAAKTQAAKMQGARPQPATANAAKKGY
ncbi:MAG TPA: hypothetical protein VNA16_04365 [Abditibacteriaceae bacterium]|nr:hypothetical protein [Abditibacteriaceae bacterium]